MKNSRLIPILTIGIILFTISCGNPREEHEKFREFLGNFSGDTMFQLNRIQFPLQIVLLDENYTNYVHKKIDKKDWIHENIYFSLSCNEIFPQVYYDFEMDSEQSPERVVAWRGIDNGIAIFYYFKLIGGKWFLVKKEDYST